MVPNARIESFKGLTSQTGRGEPVFGVERLGSPVPCELTQPSSFLIGEAAQRGVRLDAFVVVSRHSFVVAGRVPQPGDRFVVRPTQLLAEARTGDLVEIKDLGDQAVRLSLGQRVGAL